MNEVLRPPDPPLTTQAAEGLMRRRWSVAEIEAMVKAGVIAEDERFELIGGEVVPMSPKGLRHERIKVDLALYWVPRLPEDLAVAQETTFRLDPDTFLEPDFVFFRRADGLENLSAETALAAVEISDSRLVYDLGRKARLYAAFGIREVWVIETDGLVAHVHPSPEPEGFREKVTVDPDEPLRLGFAPTLDLRLRDLPLL
ncbi:Uma2 family endonuclease [Rhodoplanes azumiensis]|uniref:Uma2 family endonuclease n=1 Tax=Rhodoplanes azumiensis TaxID=1897628 RepID=A0ABW5AL10_9BRAD